MDQDEPLDVEHFDMAATRPELLFGVPYTLTMVLIISGVLFMMFWKTGHFIDDLVADAIVDGALAMFWSAAKVTLRVDYHGWGNFVSWCRLDARFLDTLQNGGAVINSFPTYSNYRCAARD